MQKTIFDYYVYCLSKGYFEYQGRARRREYWLFTLANALLSTALAVAEAGLLNGASWLTSLYFIATFLPSIAVGARRLHDIGRSGWWQILIFVPILGFIVLIVFFATAGNSGDNRFGPDPKAETAVAPRS